MIKDLSWDCHRIPCLQMEQPIVAYHLIRMIKPWKWGGLDPENQRIIMWNHPSSYECIYTAVVFFCDATGAERDEMPCHEEVTRSGSPGLDPDWANDREPNLLWNSMTSAFPRLCSLVQRLTSSRVHHSDLKSENPFVATPCWPLCLSVIWHLKNRITTAFSSKMGPVFFCLCSIFPHAHVLGRLLLGRHNSVFVMRHC